MVCGREGAQNDRAFDVAWLDADGAGDERVLGEERAVLTGLHQRIALGAFVARWWHHADRAALASSLRHELA